MTNQQRLLIAIVFVVAVAGGGILAFTLVGGGGSGASPSPVAVASPSAGAPSEGPTESAPSEAPSDAPSEAPASPSPSAAPSASPSPSPTATPRPTPAPGKPATVVFTNLKLDAKDDPAGKNRRFEFASQGTGTISVGVSTLSPQGQAIACLSADGKQPVCKTTAGGTISLKTGKRTAAFVLTVRGEGIETPLVEVTITFPAKDPAVTIKNARFDGTSSPETNGITAIVTPRADGEVVIEADWGGHPFLYEIDLFEQDGPGTQVLPNQGPATRVSERLPIVGPNAWRLLLQNIEDGFGATDMDATVAWP